MTDAERIKALEDSHNELRAMLILAGREIKKLNFGEIRYTAATEDAAGIEGSQGAKERTN